MPNQHILYQWDDELGGYEVGPFYFCSEECRDRWIAWGEKEGYNYQKDIEEVDWDPDENCDQCQADETFHA